MVLALSSSRDSCHVCPADHRGWTKEPAFLVKCAPLIPATTPQQLRPDVTSSKQRSLRIQASTKFRTQESGTLWRQATKWLLWCPKRMQQVAPQMKWYGPASDWDGIKGFNMVHEFGKTNPVNQVRTFVNVHLEVCLNLLRRLTEFKTNMQTFLGFASRETTEWFGTRHHRWTPLKIGTQKIQLSSI